MRGGLLAASAATLATAAHLTAGGAVPATGVALLLTAVLSWAGITVAERKPGVLGTTAVLGVVQLVSHGLLTALATAEDHHLHHHPHTAHPGPAAMLGLHAAAVLLTGVLLARADAAVLAAARLVAAVLPRPPAPAAPVRVPQPVVATALLAPVSVTWARLPARRGPPARR
ncbi:hypothetical protein BJP25_15220 [Actinokineospora bangkokensis]|uniref:MFS transporter n=1 Tax=Actinokineospora bangkokensis TaxID=1193682 RepID=A0A1Q9LPE8_9PSEU|nr:hypothetical protein BJP25_15220 [Actinokineospora bangkokensis]